MVSEITRHGLIVTPARRTSDLLEELISQVDWPVLCSRAFVCCFSRLKSRRLTACCSGSTRRTTSNTPCSSSPGFATGARGPTASRSLTSFEPDAEPAIRAAGVHSVLNTNGSITALVQDALLPLLNMQPQPAQAEREFIQIGRATHSGADVGAVLRRPRCIRLSG